MGTHWCVRNNALPSARCRPTPASTPSLTFPSLPPRILPAESSLNHPRWRVPGVGSAWRVSHVNEEYKLCPSYAKVLVVPAAIPDTVLLQAAQFRTSSRAPVLSWKHPSCRAGITRSSQPRTGVIGYRSSEDELVLETIRHTSEVLRSHQC